MDRYEQVMDIVWIRGDPVRLSRGQSIWVTEFDGTVHEAIYRGRSIWPGAINVDQGGKFRAVDPDNVQV